MDSPQKFLRIKLGQIDSTERHRDKKGCIGLESPQPIYHGSSKRQMRNGTGEVQRRHLSEIGDSVEDLGGRGRLAKVSVSATRSPPAQREAAIAAPRYGVGHCTSIIQATKLTKSMYSDSDDHA